MIKLELWTVMFSIITWYKVIENTAKYCHFQVLILDKECNDNTISNNDFKSNVELIIIVIPDINLKYRINKYRYNYYESGFIL